VFHHQTASPTFVLINKYIIKNTRASQVNITKGLIHTFSAIEYMDIWFAPHLNIVKKSAVVSPIALLTCFALNKNITLFAVSYATHQPNGDKNCFKILYCAST
jgi:hypothetical protein